MLRIIAYDISDPKRLRRVARVCEGYGARVQLSVFECWLDGERLEAMMRDLEGVMDEGEDRIVIYTVDAPGAKRRRVMGRSAELTERVADCVAL